MILPEICCDACPYSPTCEEERDFLIEVFGLNDEGDGPAVSEGCISEVDKA